MKTGGKIRKRLDFDGIITGLIFLFVVGPLIWFLIQAGVGTKTWKENYTQTLDNVYVRTETRKDMYEVTVKDIVKEKKKGSLYTLAFDRLDDGYTTTDFTRTFTEDEYKTFVGEGCNLLETDTHILSLIIPSRLNTEVYEVTVWRTAELGEDQFSDDDVRKIAEAYLELLREIDTFWNRFVLGTTDALQGKQPAKELGLSRTKEWADNGYGKRIFEKANEYWTSLEEAGYSKLSDEE